MTVGLWEIERRLGRQGFARIAGTDEAGAGPLAGRVYAAAVILPFGVELPYLNDSKQVTPRRREILFEQIKEQALAWSVSWVDWSRRQTTCWWMATGTTAAAMPFRCHTRRW